MKLTNRGSLGSQERPLQLARQRSKTARCFRVALRWPSPTRHRPPVTPLEATSRFSGDRRGTHASDAILLAGSATRNEFRRRTGIRARPPRVPCVQERRRANGDGRLALRSIDSPEAAAGEHAKVTEAALGLRAGQKQYRAGERPREMVKGLEQRITVLAEHAAETSGIGKLRSRALLE